MSQTLLLPAPNPFATRYVRPGAIPFLYPPAIDAASLVVRLRALGWFATIVGPHGSGKSTLVESLRPELRRAGRQVMRIALYDGQRSLPREFLDRRPWDPETVLVVDGYEQLSVWNRWRLERLCRRDRCGLLVTSHRPTRLPELHRTDVTCELLERLVDYLHVEQRVWVSTAEVRQAYSRHGANLREALFALYDLHESRARAEMMRL